MLTCFSASQQKNRAVGTTNEEKKDDGDEE
jgi:hypothetical protein